VSSSQPYASRVTALRPGLSAVADVPADDALCQSLERVSTTVKGRHHLASSRSLHSLVAMLIYILALKRTSTAPHLVRGTYAASISESGLVNNPRPHHMHQLLLNKSVGLGTIRPNSSCLQIA
jgi:hypothetical protein